MGQVRQTVQVDNRRPLDGSDWGRLSRLGRLNMLGRLPESNVRPYEGIYFHMFFIHFMVKWRLLLNCYFIDGDDFRLHIYLCKKNQFNSSLIKTDDSA